MENSKLKEFKHKDLLSEIIDDDIDDYSKLSKSGGISQELPV